MIVGFYGGKFLPVHKGHLYCIDVAAKQCDKVVVIMFINGEDELAVKKTTNDPILSVNARIAQLEKVCSLYDNVEFHIIDDTNLYKEDGTTDWDLETPIVRSYVPKMDYVYSSEPSYDAYFKRAYPEAKHILVDTERKNVPISGTLIRAMKTLEEKEQWMV